jgi:hypothetical protein
MNKHITTIESLAELIQRTRASKGDVQALDKKVQALETKVAVRPAVALARVAPLDNRRGGDTILRSGKSEGPIGDGRTIRMGSSPCHEEPCDGYASLLLSAPCGDIPRRRVC